MSMVNSTGSSRTAPAALWQPELVGAGGLFLVSWLFYLNYLAPSVVTLFDDSLEFQLVAYRLGIAHPTGYPLYLLLGKLFTFLPVGDVAYRMNLMSAFFGAATVALVYRLILQVAALEDEPARWPLHLGGALGALLLMLGPVFWRQATIAEVYTLNAFFVAALLLQAVRLPPVYAQARPGLLGLAFLFGLALTHHLTIVLLLPALGVYLFLAHRPLFSDYKTMGLGLLLALLPLLLYLYLPLRGHVGSLDGTYENSWAGFWRHVSGGGYGVFIFDNPFGHERSPMFYWGLLRHQFHTTAPGLLGLFFLFQAGQRKMLALTGLAFAGYTLFNLFYNVTDIEVFFIPAFLVWATWSGCGVAFAGYLINTARDAEIRPGLVIIILVIFTYLIAQLFAINHRQLKEEYSWQVHDYGLDILQQPLPRQETAIVGILGEMTLLRYFQQTENRRPDLHTVAADREEERLQAVEELLAAGKTVYLTRELPGAARRWSLNAVGPLIRVDPQPVTRPPALPFTVGQAVVPPLELVGYELARLPHSGPGRAPLRLGLYWRAGAVPANNLKLSARLLDAEGLVVAATDAVPVHFAYPTSAWRAGEVVSDVYDLALPRYLAAGLYTPRLIWYDPAQNAAEVGRIDLAPVTFE